MNRPHINSVNNFFFAKLSPNISFSKAQFPIVLSLAQLSLSLSWFISARGFIGGFFILVYIFFKLCKINLYFVESQSRVQHNCTRMNLTFVTLSLIIVIFANIPFIVCLYSFRLHNPSPLNVIISISLLGLRAKLLLTSAENVWVNIHWHQTCKSQ